MFHSRTIQNTVYIAIEQFLWDNNDNCLPGMFFSQQSGDTGDFFTSALLDTQEDNLIIVKAPDKESAQTLNLQMSRYNNFQNNDDKLTFAQCDCLNCVYFATKTPILLNKLIVLLNKEIATLTSAGVFKCLSAEEDGTLDYWNISSEGVELAEAPELD